MTREQLLKHWEVIEAYMNGAEVEHYSQVNKEWMVINSPNFYGFEEYRIKKQPELIPFDFSDAEMLICKVIKDKCNQHLFVITGAFDQSVLFDDVYYSYDKLLQRYTFLDGTPCGKIKE